jgi:hypothetical protein
MARPRKLATMSLDALVKLRSSTARETCLINN